MKRVVMMMVGALAAVTAFAAAQNDLKVTFWSTGPDRYADGKTFVDGELYALVWTKSGATFGGFAANGKLIDATASEVVIAGAWAKDGKCKPILHTIDAEKAATYAQGAFTLVGLDTRNADGSVSAPKRDADGQVILSVVNGWTAVAASGTTADGLSSSLGAAGGVLIETASALPDGVPQPEITGLEMVQLNGMPMLKLTVKNTVPYLRYTAAKVADDGVAPCDGPIGANGAETDEATVEVFVPANERQGLFKVVRQ